MAEINIVLGRRVKREKLQQAKRLRRRMTPAERVLWGRLRRNQLGVHFRRQQVIQGFVVDFYCHGARLIVEVDGGVHQTQRNSDRAREDALQQLGLRILRVRNEDVLRNCGTVLARIREASGVPVSRSEPQGTVPPSQQGRGTGG